VYIALAVALPLIATAVLWLLWLDGTPLSLLLPHFRLLTLSFDSFDIGTIRVLYAFIPLFFYELILLCVAGGLCIPEVNISTDRGQ
jgi:hypothetical protein